MARTWLQIHVELEGGGGIDLRPRPGRLMIVGPGHSFAQLAAAIDAAFARWDLSHLHEFELPDGRLIGYPDPDFEEPGWLDHERLKVARELKPGDEFSYVFDLGDNWRHSCRVLAQKVDPLEEYGAAAERPVPIWGWGWIPDQYGRESFDEVGEEDAGLTAS
jgi:Plasmid pRiA4b ORF-3-like protein